MSFPCIVLMQLGFYTSIYLPVYKKASMMDKDEHVMFVDALPKQQRMLIQSNCPILPFFRQKGYPLCKPAG